MSGKGRWLNLVDRVDRSSYFFLSFIFHLNELIFLFICIHLNAFAAFATLFQFLKNISEELMEVREPVVANNAAASTVVFIAPGPPNPPSTIILV